MLHSVKNLSLLETDYPLAIQFYTLPNFTINYYDAIKVTKERLQVLKIVSGIMQDADDQNITWLEKHEKLVSQLKSSKIESFSRLVDFHDGLKLTTAIEHEDQYVDHASFVCLRLSVLNSQDEMKIALHQKLEEDFFAMRISTLDELAINQFFNYYGIFHPKWCKLSPKEETNLYFFNYFKNHPDVSDPTEFSLVDLKYLRFLNHRTIPLLDGKGYIAPKKMSLVLRGYFSCHLDEVSEDLGLMLSVLETQNQAKTRFPELFRHTATLFNALMLKENIEKNEISSANLDTLAATAFPPCMRRMHDEFRAKHHLKHNGRRQYALFLKGVGLKSDETVQHFQEEFCTRGDMKPERFKEYEYYIRHAYGERGSCIDYSPKNCNYLIDHASKVYSTDDCHSCPLVASKNVDDIEDFGKHMETKWNIPQYHIESIMSCVQEKRPRAACEQYFIAVNYYKPEARIKHPNYFFNQSLGLQNNEFLTEDSFIVSDDLTSPEWRPANNFKPKWRQYSFE